MDNTFWGFGSDAPHWPVNPDGTKEQAVLLHRTADRLAEAEMIISLLAAYGIPCVKLNEHNGGAGRVILGFSGHGVGLYVPASRLADAQDLLDARTTEEGE